MKKIFSQVLDFPQMVNQKFFKSNFNDRIDKFDSKDGIRYYVKTIYEMVAFALFIWMEYNLIIAALDYMNESHTGLEKVGSVLTILLQMASVFPIAQIVRARGEALGSAHKGGMLDFVFSDFVKANIRLIGEVAALMALFAAFNFTLSFLFDANLFNQMSSGTEVLNAITPIAGLPMDLMNMLLNAIGLESISNLLNSAVSYRFDGGMPNFNGDFVWNVRDLGAVLGAYINVMMVLIGMYISLYIYSYLFGLISSLVSWVANPSLPISIKNK